MRVLVRTMRACHDRIGHSYQDQSRERSLFHFVGPQLC
jgi:hypothetical protein